MRVETLKPLINTIEGQLDPVFKLVSIGIGMADGKNLNLTVGLHRSQFSYLSILTETFQGVPVEYDFIDYPILDYSTGKEE